ncbi:MAG: hypothetical protein PWQ96_1913 [Clostridia bacterium]|jgi:transcriptional regulator with XRE-family HTH domain|nr:hypothetical protein [Clostridiales bacterium]MDK2986269.1 hypothetical protein [Clostridia bacterium]
MLIIGKIFVHYFVHNKEVIAMEIIRIGEKIIDCKKIISVIDKALELRTQGLSQQQVAERLGLDRPFISRLEKLGEVRRGRKIAVIAFPIKNKQELEETLKELGVEFSIVLTEKERWRFVSDKNGVELFNTIMDIIARLRTYDTVVVIGSNYRIRLTEALLDKEVVGIEIGKSPIEDDKYVDLKKIKELIKKLTLE